jgi:hypothetical protein
VGALIASGLLGEPPFLEWAVASVALPGEVQSGDRHLVAPRESGALLAAIDGLGHGDRAALAAESAVSALHAHTEEPVLRLVGLCHEALRRTRGAVMSLVSLDARTGSMTWVGVGNVEAVLIRRDPHASPARESLAVRGGIVGVRLPPLHAYVLPANTGDTIVLATDGVRSTFAESIRPLEPAERLADRVLAGYASGTDDALVLVAKLRWAL